MSPSSRDVSADRDVSFRQAPSFLSRGTEATRRRPGQRSLRREFVAEMRLLARLRHPCVTTVPLPCLETPVRDDSTAPLLGDTRA